MVKLRFSFEFGRQLPLLFHSSNGCRGPGDWSQELHPGLFCGWQESNYLKHLSMLPCLLYRGAGIMGCSQGMNPGTTVWHVGVLTRVLKARLNPCPESSFLRRKKKINRSLSVIRLHPFLTSKWYLQYFKHLFQLLQRPEKVLFPHLQAVNQHCENTPGAVSFQGTWKFTTLCREDLRSRHRWQCLLVCFLLVKQNNACKTASCED